MSSLITFRGGSRSMFAKRVAGGGINTTADLQNRCCRKEEGILALQKYFTTFFFRYNNNRQDWGEAGSHDEYYLSVRSGTTAPNMQRIVSSTSIFSQS